MLFDGFGYIDTDPRLPSYLPVISSPFTSSMSFSERVVNFHMKFISEHVFMPLALLYPQQNRPRNTVFNALN